MTLLSVRDVHKAYEGVELLRGVSLRIDEGARLGLVGRNASGKSTLLRILQGSEEADAGERVARRDLELGVLEQAPQLPPGETVREVVRGGFGGREAVLAELDGVHAELARPELPHGRQRELLARQSVLDGELAALGGYDVEHRVEEVIRHLGLADPDARCASLSGGELRRVALARLLLGRPDLMLLDEPTNHLDAVVIDWLEDFLLESRTPFLMVTHDRYFLDRCVDRIVELDRGVLYEYEGGYRNYLVTRAARLESEESAEASRRILLRRETAWMRRGAPARTTKAKARIDRFVELVDDEREEPLGELEFTIPPGPRLGTRVVRLTGVSKSFGGRTVVPRLDLELAPGERIGIIGPNGAGKTTLLSLCTGRLEPDTGTLAIGETVAFAHIDQLREGLDLSRSVLSEIAGSNDHVVVAGRTLRVEGFLEHMLFTGARKHAALGSLSGGELNRVLLAKLLIQGGNVLVLDEPTNDLDLESLRRLEEALMAFPGSALIVSHDRYFLDRVATRVLYLDGEGGARWYGGAVSELLEELAADRREEPRRRPSEPRKQAAVARPVAAAPRGKRITPWQRRELEELPTLLEKAEGELAAQDARLADPELYGGPLAERRAVEAARADAARRVAELYARWEELEGLGGG